VVVGAIVVVVGAIVVVVGATVVVVGLNVVVVGASVVVVDVVTQVHPVEPYVINDIVAPAPAKEPFCKQSLITCGPIPKNEVIVFPQQST
jgi:hypothetical protein